MIKFSRARAGRDCGRAASGIFIALFLATGTAHAGSWQCGLVSVELRKNMVHDYTLTIDGPFQVNPIRAEVKELPDGTITFNGEHCNLIEKEK